jgi:hypothetical protein
VSADEPASAAPREPPPLRRRRTLMHWLEYDDIIEINLSRYGNSTATEMSSLDLLPSQTGTL